MQFPLHGEQPQWTDRTEAGATTRTATYRGYSIEISVRAFAGEFAATAAYIGEHGAWYRDSQPTWGKTAEEALGKAWRSVIAQVDCDAA
ncbi:MAG TPA: hypothetical protein VEP93_02865 [Variovorax sp.]|nr:hypothetical protein [Variovorax sp.]